jgi:LPXTG-motif cell wall-anchored protein
MGMPHTGHPASAPPYGAAALIGLACVLAGLALRRRRRAR